MLYPRNPRNPWLRFAFPAGQPFAGHAAEGGVHGGVAGDGLDVEPGEVVGFLAHHVGFVAAGTDDVADVVVPVAGDILAFRDPVAVEVEDAALDAQAVPSLTDRGQASGEPTTASTSISSINRLRTLEKCSP